MENKNKKGTVRIGTAIMMTLLGIVATFNITFFISAEYYNNRIWDFQQSAEDYEKMSELEQIVSNYYIGDYDKTEAFEGALAGYVEGLGDQWSGYYTAEQTKIIDEQNANTYVGIGVTISMEEMGVRITKVAQGGPAQQAGIEHYDLITHVDGVPVFDIGGQDEIVATVRGQEGTSVEITVSRDGQSLTFDIVRASVLSEGITARLINDNIGYIVIDGFSTHVDEMFEEQLNLLIEQGAQGFIFDVRFNGGGYVSVMNNMLDLLLPEGVVISMVDKAGQVTDYTSDENMLDMPMAVLTNEYSISAAEFFAAALQEYGVAQVVGDKTAGKGFSQQLIYLSDGSSVNLSTSRYYTPKGTNLADVGITPDYLVEMTEQQMSDFYHLTEEQDTQLQKAIEVLTPSLPPAPVE